jgi:hypothetical protein
VERSDFLYRQPDAERRSLAWRACALDFYLALVAVDDFQELDQSPSWLPSYQGCGIDTLIDRFRW